MWKIITVDDCRWCASVYDLIHTKDEEAVIKTYNLSQPENFWVGHLFTKAGFKTVPQVITPDGKWLGGYEDTLQYFMEGN